jgi:Cytosine deaminase and related metal-dependent hydrolases
MTGKSQNRTLITNVTIYTADNRRPYIDIGWLAFEGDKIIALGRADEKPPHCENIIDKCGNLLLPGFINPHWHESFVAPNFESPDDKDIQQTAYSKGGDVAALGGLFGFISNVGNMLTADEALAIARWSLWTQLRSGTTTLGDLGSANTADAMAQAAIELGMRLFVSRWCSDIMIPADGSSAIQVADGEAQLNDVAQLMTKWHNHSSGLINGMPSVMGTFGSSDKQLHGIKAIADDYNATYAMHLGALANEDEANQRVFKQTSIQRVADLGLLSSRLLTVHTAYGSDKEFAALLKAGVHICHAPGHYGMLGEKTLSDTARFSQLMANGYPLACSTDGDINYTGGMTEAMRAAHLGLNEVANNNTCCPPTRALLSGTLYSAKALNLKNTGQLKPGMQADFVLIDCRNWRYKNSKHPLRTHLLTGSSDDIHSVYIAGQRVLENGQSTRFNEDSLWQDYLCAVNSARSRIRP